VEEWCEVPGAEATQKVVAENDGTAGAPLKGGGKADPASAYKPGRAADKARHTSAEEDCTVEVAAEHQRQQQHSVRLMLSVRMDCQMKVQRYLDRVQRQHPTVVQTVQTHRATRRVLHRQRELLEEMKAGGRLVEGDAERLISDINLRLKKLYLRRNGLWYEKDGLWRSENAVQRMTHAMDNAVHSIRDSGGRSTDVRPSPFSGLFRVRWLASSGPSTRLIDPAAGSLDLDPAAGSSDRISAPTAAGEPRP